MREREAGDGQIKATGLVVARCVIVITAGREYRHTQCLGNCDDVINELISLPEIGHTNATTVLNSFPLQKYYNTVCM